MFDRDERVLCVLIIQEKLLLREEPYISRSNDILCYGLLQFNALISCPLHIAILLTNPAAGHEKLMQFQPYVIISSYQICM